MRAVPGRPGVPPLSLLVRSIALAAVAATVAACSDSSTAPTPIVSTQTLLVDASTSFQYVKLGNPATIVTVADPSTSSAWDMALFATTVTLNGGQAGPGDVTGYCICENAAATTAQIQALTADNQLVSFEAIGESAIPGNASFVSDALAPAIEGWFDGTGAAITVHASRSWLLRSGTT